VKILVDTKAKAPSVIQVCAQDVSPEHLTDLVVRGLQQHEEMLDLGALISIDPLKSSLIRQAAGASAIAAKIRSVRSA
jgi:predicted nuclease of predicted toxin-antitoxin system